MSLHGYCDRHWIFFYCDHYFTCRFLEDYTPATSAKIKPRNLHTVWNIYFQIFIPNSKQVIGGEEKWSNWFFLNGGCIKWYKSCTSDSCFIRKHWRRMKSKHGLLALLDLSRKRKLFLIENCKDPWLHLQGPPWENKYRYINLLHRNWLHTKLKKSIEEAGFVFISYPNKTDFNHVFRRRWEKGGTNRKATLETVLRTYLPGRYKGIDKNFQWWLPVRCAEL